MINRYFGLVGRFFFLAFVLGSVQNLNVAQTAPQDDPKMNELKFVTIKLDDTPIEKALEALCTTIKLDVVFDDSVENKKVAIHLQNVSVRKAIEAILKGTDSQVKMKDDHTLLIFADTPENREKYADLKSWS
jgi:type II secretory pathway component HofQ